MKIFNKIASIKKVNDHIIITFLGINLKLRKSTLKSRVENIEKELVMNSGLWDAEYYVRTYHPEMTKYEALEYYCKTGYKNFENPSPIFNAKLYNVKSCNPIIDFITKGRYCLHRLFYKNEFIAPKQIVDKYIEERNKRQKSNKVIYTCITDNYDNIYDLQAYYYTDNNWDYICFTDNQEWINKKQIGIWQIRPIIYKELDSSRNNRWHKLHPHILFEDYDESVYIDANINILTSKFFDMVNSTDKDILLPIHSNRMDLYKELLWAKEIGFDKEDVINKQYQLIKNSGFPQNYGMFENNIIYRKHHKLEIKEMMNEWWNFISRYCKRDQTSLAYIFWKHNRKISDYAISNTRIDYKNYCIFAHRKEWELCKY